MRNRLISLAKQLRKSQTEHEAKLWAILRSRRFSNVKFVRQFPVGKYIVDFCCRKKKLIIELDGGQHNEKDQVKYDQIRDEYLRKRSYKVLRIPNNELSENLDGVSDEIYHILFEKT